MKKLLLVVITAMALNSSSWASDLKISTDNEYGPKSELLATAKTEDLKDARHCGGNRILNINIPYLHNNKKEERFFKYNFRYLCQNKDFTTIVVLPGGPGDTSIEQGSSLENIKEFYPNNFNFLFIDPRGTGLNSNIPLPLPEGFFTTKQLSMDVISVINYLGITNYILDGTSYGTVWATSIAALAEQNYLSKPQALVLHGTTGKFMDDSEGIKGLIKEFEKVKKLIKPEAVSLLSKSPLPLNLSPQQWGNVILRLMATDQVNTVYYLNALINPSPENQKELETIFTTLSNELDNNLGHSDMAVILNTEICCRELFDGENTKIALIDGKIVGLNGKNQCSDIVPDQPFDSSEYLTTAPIYYLQGANDPLTYEENARYHFDHQILTTRHFITFLRMGHVGLIRSLPPKCKKNILSSIYEQKGNINEAVASCEGALEIETLNY